MTPDTTHTRVEDTWADYYKMLQLPPGSTSRQIHAQYRRLAMQHHPDRNPDRRAWSEEQLRLLNEAYRALAQRDAPAPAASAPPPAPAAPPAVPGVPAHTLPQRAPMRRAARYVAVIGAVCALSVAYADWSQSPLTATLPPGASTLPVPETAPAAEAPPAAPNPAPTTAPLASVAVHADETQTALAAQFTSENGGVDMLVAQAAQIAVRVNRETLHAPQSRRTQQAEQLTADALELSRLQHSVRSGLTEMRLPTTPDLRRGQVADLQLALFQMGRQRQAVRRELAAFSAPQTPARPINSSPVDLARARELYKHR